MVGSQSLMLVLGVVLLLFGGKKLPELAGSLGRSMKEFKKAVETPPESEAQRAATPPAAIAASPTRACAACETALEAEWSHCPSCGAAAPRPSTVA